jgi:hypothetical protein
VAAIMRGIVMLTAPVSASAKVRDEIRFIVRDHLADKVRMTELEYQPL